MICCTALLGTAQTGTDTLTVYFRQGKSVIDLSHMGNDTVAAKIKSLNNRHLSGIAIQGSASPEGSTAINQRLSRVRAKAIAQFFNLPDSIVVSTFTGSNWAGLQTRVTQDPNVPHKTEVEQAITDIITSPDNACPIDVLRNMHNGKPYQYLCANHFPFLRRSQIIFAGINHGASTGSIAETSTEVVYIPTVSASETNSSPLPDNADEQRCITTAFPHDNKGYIFSLKTNMLYDAALIPNIGIEFPIGRHFSVGANWRYAWWKNRSHNRHWRIYGGDINTRYWFNGGAPSLNGHHVGFYGTVLLYQVAFGNKGYISGIPGQNMTGGKPWIGGGVEYGYSLNVHPHFNIDFSLGVGYTSGEQRNYRLIDDCYVWQSSSRKHWFGPTKAEISLVWKIGKLPQTVKSVKQAGQ